MKFPAFPGAEFVNREDLQRLTKNEIFALAFIIIGFQLLVFQLIPKPIPFGKSVRRVSVDRCFTERNFNVPSTVVALAHQ